MQHKKKANGVRRAIHPRPEGRGFSRNSGKEHHVTGRVDYYLLPVVPPAPDDETPLSPPKPRTDQGTDQKTERAEAATTPPSALSEEPRKAMITPMPARTALPDTWELPKDWKAWAEAQRPDLGDITRVATSFHLYHLSKGTQSACWSAEWKRWVLRERAPKEGPPRRYASLVGPQPPVPVAVQTALEQSELRRLEQLRQNGIDPRTGLRLEGSDRLPPKRQVTVAGVR